MSQRVGVLLLGPDKEWHSLLMIILIIVLHGWLFIWMDACIGCFIPRGHCASFSLKKACLYDLKYLQGLLHINSIKKIQTLWRGLHTEEFSTLKLRIAFFFFFCFNVLNIGYIHKTENSDENRQWILPQICDPSIAKSESLQCWFCSGFPHRFHPYTLKEMKPAT